MYPIAWLGIGCAGTHYPLCHLCVQRIQHRTRETQCARAATKIRRVTDTIRERRIDGSVYCDCRLTDEWVLFPM